MPIYEYRCNNAHQFEVFQSMADDPVTTCQECGAPVERVFHPIAVHFKGSGFYTTDYARKGAGKAGEEGGSTKADSDSGSDSSEKKSGADSSKPESGSSSKSSESSKAKSPSDQGAAR